MNTTTARLNVEQLGSRILPSVNPIAGSAATSAGIISEPLVHPQVPLVSATANLQGAFHGTLRRFTGVPADIGMRFAVDGTGSLAGLGSFSIRGVLHGTGFIARGNATGLLTLTNSRGAITVRLTGPQQPGFSPLPGSFHFTVVAGSTPKA